jgi:hypothetical protein
MYADARRRNKTKADAAMNNHLRQLERARDIMKVSQRRRRQDYDDLGTNESGA